MLNYRRLQSKSPANHNGSAKRARWRSQAIWLAASLFSGCLAGENARAAAAAPEPYDTRTPRGHYNEGTRRFKEGKLREAESLLQTAVASNDGAVQPDALYNLGHIRFQQGQEALKDSANPKAVESRGRRAAEVGEDAIKKADDALAGYDLDAIIEAYMHGRGVRKQLKAATDAVKRALDSYSAVLLRWQRASGDFKSAAELRAGDKEAGENGEIVDRHIAQLVDQEELLKMAMKNAGGKREELKQRMDQMKKLMPKMMQAQCQGDEEEEDEDEQQPKEPQKGQEKESREGREMAMTWEEAVRLLEGLKLDANRKLPMGMDQTGNPKNRSGRDW